MAVDFGGIFPSIEFSADEDCGGAVVDLGLSERDFLHFFLAFGVADGDECPVLEIE